MRTDDDPMSDDDATSTSSETGGVIEGSSLAFAALSFLVAEWGWRHEPNANFFLTPGRAWELMAGALCANAAIDNQFASVKIQDTPGAAAIIA